MKLPLSLLIFVGGINLRVTNGVVQCSNYLIVIRCAFNVIFVRLISFVCSVIPICS